MNNNGSAVLMKNFTLLVPMGSLAAYMSSVKEFPVLSEEEEKQLSRRWLDHQDLDAAKYLVVSHLRHVVGIAKRYMGYGLQLSDLIQEGNIGLMKAVKKFNPEIGVRLFSFAIYWIKAEIHEFILRNWRIVKIATTKSQRRLFFKLKSFKQKFGENCAVISKETGIKLKTVEQMNARLSYKDANIEDAYNIADPNTNPAHFIEAEENLANKEKLISAVKNLDPRSRDILEKRWLSKDKMTLQTLALNYKISLERIRQIEKNAIDKLRSALA